MKVVFEFLKTSKNIKFCSRAPSTEEEGRKLGVIASPSFLFINTNTKLIMLMLFCSISCTVFGGYFYGIPLPPYTFICLNFKLT